MKCTTCPGWRSRTCTTRHASSNTGRRSSISTCKIRSFHTTQRGCTTARICRRGPPSPIFRIIHQPTTRNKLLANAYNQEQQGTRPVTSSATLSSQDQMLQLPPERPSWFKSCAGAITLKDLLRRLPPAITRLTHHQEVKITTSTKLEKMSSPRRWSRCPVATSITKAPTPSLASLSTASKAASESPTISKPKWKKLLQSSSTKWRRKSINSYKP